jgi:hypothetical protein
LSSILDILYAQDNIQHYWHNIKVVLILLDVSAKSNPVHHSELKNDKVKTEAKAYVAENFSPQVSILETLLWSGAIPAFDQIRIR